MTSGDHDSLLVLGMQVYKFRIGIYLNSCFLCSDKFRIIDFCMHTQDDKIQITSDFISKPSHLFRCDTGILQPTQGWMVYLIV